MKQAQKILFITVIILSIFLHLITLNQMGRTWDEGDYISSGYRYINLIKQGKIMDPYLIQKPDHPPLMKYLYGIAGHFDTIGKTESDGTPQFVYNFTHSRWVAVALGVITTFFVILIGWHFISPVTGIAAGLIFTTIPLVIAMTQLATIEAGILAFFSMSLFGFLKLLKRYSHKGLIFTGVATGLLLATKFTDVLIIPIFLTIFIIKWLFAKKSQIKVLNCKNLAVLFIIAGLTFITLWPEAIINYHQVLANIHQVRFAEGMTPPVSRFMGINQPNPWYFYIVHFFIGIPALYLIMFGIGIFYGLKSRNWVFFSLLATFLIPFAQSFYTIKRDGLRYLIEIFIPFSLIAGIAFEKAKFKLLWFTLITLYAIFIVLKPIAPYYLDYYNEIVDGTKGVYQNQSFDLDWWGEGNAEAIYWLDANAPDNSIVGLQLYPLHTIPTDNPKKFWYWQYDPQSPMLPEYVVVDYLSDLRTNFNEGSLLKNYHLIHSVKADGANLVNIYQAN